MERITGGGILILAMLAGTAAAQDPRMPPGDRAPAARPAPGAVPPRPDPAYEAARAAFEVLPEPERRALQDALMWTGDFNAVISGAFGRRTFEALEAVRLRSGGADPLDPRGRAGLLAAGEAARRAAGFRVAADPGSGAVMGVPEALLSRRTGLPAGTRWQSADGRATLETRAYPPGTETLDALFERATAPMNERRVTYKLRRPDFFVVTAETGAGRSYIRYAAGPQGVRGFLVGYDRALAGTVDRLVIAVANAFEPFPGSEPVAGAATQAVAPTAQIAAPSAPPPRTASATGLTVAAARVLTAASALEDCPSPWVGGAAARVIARDPTGLALLEAPGAPTAAMPAVRTGAASSEEPLMAVAAGADGITATPGTASAGGVVAPLQPGAAGAPVLDRSGRLAGLVARYPAAPRLIAGVAPPMSAPLLAAAAVPSFLAGKGIGGAAAGAAASVPPRGEGAGAIVPAVVAITCR